MISEEHLKRLSRDVAEPSVRGKWFSIRICPDAAAGELLNMGVGFIDANGILHTKIATDFSRLTCLYDDRVDADSFARLADVLQADLHRQAFRADRITELSPSLVPGEEKYAAGDSIEAILDDLFSTTVTLGRPRDLDSALNKQRGISNDQARHGVFARLRKRMGVKAEQLIAKEPAVVRDEDGNDRKIFIPIRRPGKLAAQIVSVWSRDDTRRRLSLFEAGFDLDTVHHYSRKERLGLFIVRPFGKGYSERELSRIDAEIDEIDWRLKKLDDAMIETAPTPEELADRIQVWAKAA